MQQPTCSHCRRGARTCSKESDHIILGDANVGIVRRRTRYDLSFDEDQIWMGLPSGTMPGEYFVELRKSSLHSIAWSRLDPSRMLIEWICSQ
jgi:hypothetical protein